MQYKLFTTALQTVKHTINNIELCDSTVRYKFEVFKMHSNVSNAF